MTVFRKKRQLKLFLGTDKNRLFLSVPLQFLAFQATKYAFFSGSPQKTEVFRGVLIIVFIVFVLISGFSLLTENVLIGKSPVKTALALEIVNTDNGKVYKSFPIKHGEEFAIEFIHSVNNSPVRETFKVEGKMIKLSAVRFFSFGAGMLTELDEGLTLSRDGEAMVITGFTRAYSELNYIVGTVSDHLLLIDGQNISLRELCGKNAHVTIKAR